MNAHLTPTQLRLAKEHRERQQRIAAAASRLQPPKEVIFKPAPVEYWPPITKQMQLAWQVIEDEGLVDVAANMIIKWFPGGIRAIQMMVCEHFGVTYVDLVSQRRTQVLVRPRQAAMYLCKKHTTRSLPEIGRMFGGRDHTTVLHAVRKVPGLMEQDEQFAAAVLQINAKIQDQIDAANARALDVHSEHTGEVDPRQDAETVQGISA